MEDLHENKRMAELSLENRPRERLRHLSSPAGCTRRCPTGYAFPQTCICWSGMNCTKKVASILTF